MDTVKKYGASMLGLLILLIATMVTLNLLKKVPGVGKVASAAQELAIDGHM